MDAPLNTEVALILDNIRSAHNVGSIFRTADAFGVSRIFLAGYTPAPIDRFGRAQKEVAKTALGAEETTPWESVASARECLDELHEQDYHIAALEQSEHSVSLASFAPPQRIALILGAEVEGVSADVLNAVNTVVEIPMSGTKESLNVSVAAGIALYHIRVVIST